MQPVSPSRKFGVEIEFFGISRMQAAQALRAAGLDASVERYNHSTKPYWKLVSDASVTGSEWEDSGHELVSPPLQGEEGLRDLAKAVSVLKELGAKVDMTCGLHVHHDISDLDLRQIKGLCKKFVKWEPQLDKYIAKSRRGDSNSYCLSNNGTLTRYYSRKRDEEIEDPNQLCLMMEKARTLKELLDAFQYDYTWRGQEINRYTKLNFAAYARQQTVEFRLHHGTLIAQKVVNWVRLTQAIVEDARLRPFAYYCDDLEKGLFDAVPATMRRELKTYYRKRAEALTNTYTVTVEREGDDDYIAEDVRCGSEEQE